MDFKILELKKFLVEATQFGYANPDKAKVTKENDRSTTITFSKGEWSSHDNFFGGEPYGGRQVVFYKDKPVFIMVYYGKVLKNVKNVDAVYTFLQLALSKISVDYPYRGPKEVRDNNLHYRNTWIGVVDSFSGEETIFENNQKVYEAMYMGGLVDVRASNEI